MDVDGLTALVGEGALGITAPALGDRRAGERATRERRDATPSLVCDRLRRGG
jgi:hypothetical protein